MLRARLKNNPANSAKRIKLMLLASVGSVAPHSHRSMMKA